MRCKQMRIVQLTFVFLFFALVRVSGTPPVSNDVDLSGAMQQGIVVTGTVSDQEGSLPGVSVAVKGTTQGVVTDLSGKFTITVPNRDAVLIFSFVGYVTQEIEVGEAYFLRAWWQHELLRCYGGLSEDGKALGYVIVTRTFSEDECETINTLPRNTFEECVQQILDDCDTALVYLPMKYNSDVNNNADDPYWFQSQFKRTVVQE